MHRPSGSLWACSVLLVLGACARTTPPSAELTTGSLPDGARPGATFAAPATTGPVVDGWLATFADPRLDQLVAEALAHNRDLAVAVARLEAAAGEARLAGADLAPQISYAVGASTGRVGDAPRRTQVGVGVQLSWELDVWGRLSSAERAAQERYASAAADLDFARLSLAAAVAKAWILAIQATSQVEIARANLTLLQANAELTALRAQHGRASDYDVALARSSEATAGDRVRQAMSGRQRAVRALETLVGRYPADALAPGTALPAMPGAVPSGLPSELLERRPDLIAATRRIAVAFNQRESAEAARLPRLAITGEAGVAANSFRNLSLDDAFWNLGANLLGPIFDGGRLREQVRIADAQQQAAIADFGASAQRAFQQVETTLADEAILAERVVLTAAADAAQHRAQELAQLRFKAGTIDLIALNIVQGAALNARLADLAVRAERLSNRIDLHLALGGGFAAAEQPKATTP